MTIYMFVVNLHTFIGSATKEPILVSSFFLACGVDFCRLIVGLPICSIYFDTIYRNYFYGVTEMGNCNT
jgi:hypothetical protein